MVTLLDRRIKSRQDPESQEEATHLAIIRHSQRPSQSRRPGKGAHVDGLLSMDEFDEICPDGQHFRCSEHHSHLGILQGLFLKFQLKWVLLDGVLATVIDDWVGIVVVALVNGGHFLEKGNLERLADEGDVFTLGHYSEGGRGEKSFVINCQQRDDFTEFMGHDKQPAGRRKDQRQPRKQQEGRYLGNQGFIKEFR